MIGSEPALFHLGRAAVQVPRRVEPLASHLDRGEVVPQHRDLVVVVAVDVFEDGERFAVQRLGFVGSALIGNDGGQSTDVGGVVGVRRPDRATPGSLA